MKRKNVMEKMIDIIKKLILQSNGKLLVHDVELPKEFHEFENDILGDLEMKHASEDKKNLQKDGHRLKKDISRAVEDYKNEYCY